MLSRRRFVAQCSGALFGLASAGAWAASTRGTVLVVGDSLSAEYGIARGSGWVALLEQRLQAQGLRYGVVNASISGDTTAGGRTRLAPLLSMHRPSHLIIELGGNDALRGMPLAHTRENLVAMVRAGKAAGTRPLLVGMQLPPNYGASYGRQFAALFEEVASAERVPVVPFLLAAFATRPDAESWFQPDRIHPLAKAHPLMLDTVWPVLKRML
ncbi:MAG: arylesterase [Burkholderiales bacterium]|nr:arylesterase [Burkholderiales bacterium]